MREGDRWRVIDIGWSGRSPSGLNVKKKPAIQRSGQKGQQVKDTMEMKLDVLENLKEPWATA